ncbi:MAG: hypothetical protein FJW27_19775 [Acidimicrobiia bacterium]|nr:hypothetical protein [Acidimicrobiia bacterium]
MSTNARVRWKYRPGSEPFVVYDEERDSEAAIGVPGLLNRAFSAMVLWLPQRREVHAAFERHQGGTRGR